MANEIKDINNDTNKSLGEYNPTLEVNGQYDGKLWDKQDGQLSPDTPPFPSRGEGVPFPEQVSTSYNHTNLQGDTPSQPSFFGNEDSPVQDMPSFFPVDSMNLVPKPYIADERAKRYDYAMDAKSPGKDQILTGIASGSEEPDRLRHAVEERTDLNVKRAAMVQRYIAQMGPDGVSVDTLNELQKADKAEVEAARADPKTFYERKFAAKAATESTADLHDGTPAQQEPVKVAIRSFQQILTNQQTARKFMEDTQSKLEDRTYGQAAKTNFVPFYRYLTLSSAYRDPTEAGGLLLGTNMRAQIEAAYRLSPDKFYETQNEVIKNLGEKDPELAAEYASALVGYTVGSQAMDNIASLIDLSMIKPASVIGAAKYFGVTGGKLITQGPGNYIANLKLINAASTLRGVTKSLAGTKVDYLALLPEARQAQVAAIDSIKRKALNTGQVADWDELAKTIQPIINPQSVLTGANNMTVEEAARLEIGMLKTSTTALQELISRPATLERLSAEEVALATSTAEKYVRTMYEKTTLGSRINQVKAVNMEAGANLVNTDAIAVYLGTSKATGFATGQSATLAAKNMGIEKFATEEINGSHYIKTIHYVDETDPSLRSFAKSSDKYTAPNSWAVVHGLMSRVRMRDSLIPKQLSEDFKVTQASTNRYFAHTRDQFLDDFSLLGKQERKDLDHYIETERDFREQNGPATQPGAVTRGQESKTVGEFEKNYLKFHQRFPTLNETKTYFSWRQWNDVDYAVRNLDLTRDMSRIGIASHELRFRIPGQIDSYYTPKLEGKALLSFPWDRKGDAGILEWDAAAPWNGRHARKTFISDKIETLSADQISAGRTARLSREEIDDMVTNQGYKVLHLTPWSKKDLRDTMKTWGGYGGGGGSPAPGVTPVPKPANTAMSANQKLAAKMLEDKGKYMQMSADAGTEQQRDLYMQMSTDPIFREHVEKLGIPQTPWDIENTITDFYRTGASTGNAVKETTPNSLHRYTNHRLQYGLRTEADFPAKYSGTNTGFNVDQTVYYHDEAGSMHGPADIRKFENTAEHPDVIANPKLNIGKVAHLEGVNSPVPIDRLYHNKREATHALPDKVTARNNKEEFDYVRGWALKTYGEKVRIRRQPGSGLYTLIDTEAGAKFGKVIFQDASVDDLKKAGFEPPAKAPVMTPDLIKNPKYHDYTLTKPSAPPGATTPGGTTPPVSGGGGIYGTSSGPNIAKGPFVPTGHTPGSPTTTVKVADNEQGWDPGSFDYILIKPEVDMRSSALDFVRFPHQEGGHTIMTDPWMLRQPQIYKHQRDKSVIHTYEGDKNAYSARTEADAREMHTHLETVRNIMKEDVANGTNNAEAYYSWKLQGTNKNFKDFKNRFVEYNKDDGELSVAHPFVVTPTDKSSWDYIQHQVDKDGIPIFQNLENQRDSAHNLFTNELNLQFALQKSDRLDSVVRQGTKDMPTFGSQAQGRLSPMSTLINTTNQMIKGRMIDDLKIKSAENFGKSFAAVIDADIDHIRRDPMYYILNPKWKTGLRGADLDVLNAAKDYRRAVVDFMGVESPGRDAMITLQRTAAETIQKRLGQKSYDAVDRYLLRSGAYSPIRWLNNVVFDQFFGVFNVKQLTTQAMTSFHTVAVLGPKTGLQAGFAAHLVRPLLYNEFPQRAAMMANIAAKLGIKREHFLEAMQSYKNSGWHIIGGETAVQDDFINQSIKESFIERSRSMGRVFFKEGDRYTRSTAYMGAYLEWRQANPLTKLNPRIEKEILNRADTLSLNMTSASNAMIAKGAAAIPMKFTTYYLRMMEQMLPGWTGSKLTPKERMMAYAMYATAFGAPITAAGTFGLWPIHKEISKSLIERGYDTDENKVLKFFNEGLAGLLPSLVGINQNTSEALGPSGTSWLYDIKNGRSPIFDIVTGVAGTKLEDTYENAWPFFSLIANQFRGDDKKYPLEWQDLELFARSISSVNNYWKAIQMHNTGVYMTKNRTPLMKGVDDTDALYGLLFGTEPSKVQKAFLQTDMTRQTQLLKDDARKNIMRYYRLQMKSITEGDAEAAHHYGKAVKWLVNAGGFTPDEYNRLFSDAISKNGDLVHQAEQKFNESTPERQQMYLNKIRGRQEQQEQGGQQ